MARIVTVQTLFTEKEAIEVYTKWVSSQEEASRKNADRIFHHTKFKYKHLIASPEILLSQRTFEEDNKLYIEKAIGLGTTVLEQTLLECNIQPEELDYLITTSCTGFMIPSVNAYIANNVGLRKDIKHLPITESGCAAGVTALIYANDILTAYPDKKVAIITIELPSNTMQVNDYSLDNVVETAPFSDGVACAILDNKQELGCRILDSKMYQIPNTTDIWGYNLTNSGLKMNLDKCIPQIIQDNFYEITEPFLNKNGFQIGQVDNFIIHPSGVKSLDKIEELLAQHNRDVHLSRQIMENYGNMSSSTVLFILEEKMRNNFVGETTLMLSFGPGFTANQVLLQWC